MIRRDDEEGIPEMFVIWQGPYLIVSFGSIILSGNKYVTTEHYKISFEGEAQMFGPVDLG